MYFVQLFLFSVIIFGCYCEESISNVDRENLTVEIDDDNEYVPKRTPLEQHNITKIIQGGFDLTEHVHHDVIDADLGIMKYVFQDSDVLGLNYCKVLKTEVNKDISSMRIDVRCPKILVKGHYTATGILIVMPIEGNGEYTLDCEDYFVSINTGMKRFTGKDGKEHLKFKTYSLHAEVNGKVTYSLTNLFGGNQELSDALHKFMNDNWKAVAEFAQYPIWYPNMKMILKNANRLLKPVPLDELILY